MSLPNNRNDDEIPTIVSAYPVNSEYVTTPQQQQRPDPPDRTPSTLNYKDQGRDLESLVAQGIIEPSQQAAVANNQNFDSNQGHGAEGNVDMPPQCPTLVLPAVVKNGGGPAVVTTMESTQHSSTTGGLPSPSSQHSSNNKNGTTNPNYMSEYPPAHQRSRLLEWCKSHTIAVTAVVVLVMLITALSLVSTEITDADDDYYSYDQPNAKLVVAVVLLAILIVIVSVVAFVAGRKKREGPFHNSNNGGVRSPAPTTPHGEPANV